MANEESMDPRTAEDLLRRFEPVIRFTKGEWFYPMDCEPYVDACSLWVKRPDEDAVCVVPPGELTLDRLAQQPEDTTGAVHYLKIRNPTNDEKRGLWARWRARRSHTNPDWPKETFRAGRGRLARVGYISRLADALFSLALLARGRVPGGDVEGDASCTAASWRKGNASHTTETSFARMVGSSCGTGSSTLSMIGGATFSAPTTTRPTGRNYSCSSRCRA